MAEAIHAYEPQEAGQLRLQVGDRLVLSEHNAVAWSRGYLEKDPSKTEGVLPGNHVRVCPALQRAMSVRIINLEAERLAKEADEKRIAKEKEEQQRKSARFIKKHSSARASFAFSPPAGVQGQLTIKEGDMLVITDHNESGWSNGYLQNDPSQTLGVVPGNHVAIVQEVVPAPVGTAQPPMPAPVTSEKKESPPTPPARMADKQETPVMPKPKLMKQKSMDPATELPKGFVPPAFNVESNRSILSTASTVAASPSNQSSSSADASTPRPASKRFDRRPSIIDHRSASPATSPRASTVPIKMSRNQKKKLLKKSTPEAPTKVMYPAPNGDKANGQVVGKGTKRGRKTTYKIVNENMLHLTKTYIVDELDMRQ
jgi:hypothetical protein